MKMYYLVASLFIVGFFPRVLTRACCYDRINDKYYIKKMSQYYLIYAFWIFLFTMLCLFMGSSADVDHTFNHILYFVDFNTGRRDSAYVETLYDEKDYKYQGDFTWVYAIGNSVDIVTFLDKKIEENLSKEYKVTDYKIEKLNLTHYVVEGRGSILADVTIVKKWHYLW